MHRSPHARTLASVRHARLRNVIHAEQQARYNRKASKAFESKYRSRMSAAGISGASRKAGFGEGTPQQVSREGQNRRIADFGTVVETCSQ